MENAWKISIGGDCYTVGKIIEWLLYVMYYLTTKEGGKFADERY
jgi:hypothetical protein